MTSNYKVLVNAEAEEKDNETHAEIVKEGGLTFDFEHKKPKWLDPALRTRMKRCRKLLLLLVCVAFVIFFVLLNIFVIRKGPAKCRAVQQPTTSRWNLTVSGFDISTRLTLTSYHGDTKNIVFGYHSTHKTNDTGVMMINGSSGSIIWKQMLYSTPSSIDCNSIDINKDGIKDCVVIGKQGLMAVLNVATGKPFWYMHNHEQKPTPSMTTMPLVTPFDFNHDHVSELISLITMDDGQRHLIFISGMSGRILGEFLPFPSWCTQVTSPMQIVKKSKNEAYLVISCVTDTRGEIWVANVRALHATVKRMYPHNVHSPLFYKIFKCEGATTEISLFGGAKETVIAVCNNGEISALNVSRRKIIWKALIPFITHSRVIGTEPSIIDGKLITLWAVGDASRSVLVALDKDSGKIEWEYTPTNGAISSAMPYYLKRSSGKFESLIKSVKCHQTKLLFSNNSLELCHCTESYYSYYHEKKAIDTIMNFSRIFNTTGTCKIHRSLSSAIIGDILGDGSKQVVIVKRFLANADHKADQFNFNITISMLRMKSWEC